MASNRFMKAKVSGDSAKSYYFIYKTKMENGNIVLLNLR